MKLKKITHFIDKINNKWNDSTKIMNCSSQQWEEKYTHKRWESLRHKMLTLKTQRKHC